MDAPPAANSATTSTNPSIPPIQFYAFAKPIDAPSSSGFCQKLETWFRATNLRYEQHDTTMFTGPKGKLPYIMLPEKGNDKLGDSHLIIRHLIQLHPELDLNAPLNAEQRADTRAYQAHLEELVYAAVIWERWAENFEACKAELDLPWLVRPVLTAYLRRKLVNGMWNHGIGRHSPTEIYTVMSDFVDGIALRYVKAPFFHQTEDATEIDIIIYGFLANALGLKSNPRFSSLVLAKPELVTFMQRQTKKWFPEYKQLLTLLDSPQQ